MTATFPMEEALVLDAAFGLAKQAGSPRGHIEAKRRLQQTFPALSSDLTLAFYSRAVALVDACYDAGDQCLDRRTTESEAIASLRQRFPGFSSQTYDQALAWGCFISR